MSKAWRAVYLQLAAVALVGFLSWFFPIAEVVQRAQAALMDWGRWSALLFVLLTRLALEAITHLKRARLGDTRGAISA